MRLRSGLIGTRFWAISVYLATVVVLVCGATLFGSAALATTSGSSTWSVLAEQQVAPEPPSPPRSATAEDPLYSRWWEVGGTIAHVLELIVAVLAVWLGVVTLRASDVPSWTVV